MSLSNVSEPVCILRGHRSSVSAMCFGGPVMQWLITGDTLGELRVWYLATQRCVFTAYWYELVLAAGVSIRRAKRSDVMRGVVSLVMASVGEESKDWNNTFSQFAWICFLGYFTDFEVVGKMILMTERRSL